MHQRYRLVISPEAAADISAMHAYISEDSPASASSLVAQIFAAIESLADVPHRTVFQAGRARGAAVRSLPVKPYVIYFRVFDDDQVVKIQTVRHGARRRPGRFP